MENANKITPQGGFQLNCLVGIPAFREEGRIGSVVRDVKKTCEHVLVVDDGSDDNTADEAKKAGAIIISHPRNMGKGVALNTAFKYARDNGYEVIITMDGDGQHDPADLINFIKEYETNKTLVIIGNRMNDPRTMPLVRRMTNLFMSWLLSKRMKQWIPDTQCGYRLYNCKILNNIKVGSDGFAAESEILLILAERGIRMGCVPVKVIYRDEKSKIRPLKDTLRFFSMLHRYDQAK